MRVAHSRVNRAVTDLWTIQKDPLAFVRSGLTPARTVSVIFHETFHIGEFIRKDKASLAFSELHASAFALHAAFGDLHTLTSSLTDEIELYTECLGSPAIMRNTIKQRQANAREQAVWLAMLKERQKYSDDADDDDDEEVLQLENLPVKRRPFDAKLLAQASEYLRSTFEEAQAAAAYSERFDRNMQAYRLRTSGGALLLSGRSSTGTLRT
jgi:hypothetical protein